MAQAALFLRRSWKPSGAAHGSACRIPKCASRRRVANMFAGRTWWNPRTERYRAGSLHSIWREPPWAIWIGMPYSKMRFSTASGEYVCRSYLVESENGALSGRLVALHLERAAMGDLAIQDISARYRLSEREEQTLKGVLMGLSTKEVADQMHISPNTVKAYMRLIMIKLGVATRWAIIAKVIGSRESMDETTTSSRSRATGVDWH